MRELLKKEFELIVLWKVLKYNQMSYKECLEFDYYIQNNKITVWERAITYLQVKLWLNAKELKKIDLKKFFDTYIDTALRLFYGKKRVEWKPKQRTSIDSAYIMRMSSKLWIDPIKMIEEYTPEALHFCGEGAIWNENEKTKEWQNRNMRKLQAMQLQEWDKDSDLEAIKKMRERKALQSKNNQWL